MRNKKTISLGDKFHLFESKRDKETGDVYIDLEDITDCCFELWEVEDGQTSSKARIKIPKKVWAKMMKDWTNYKIEDQSESQ